ncbi:MAG: hypothetical protein Q9175_001612 [Cornicularia normoerica]
MEHSPSKTQKSNYYGTNRTVSDILLSFKMLELRNCFGDFFLGIFLYLCAATTAQVHRDVGRHGSPSTDELAAFVYVCKPQCSTVMEMCAELARDEIHGSTTATQNFCSQQFGDGVGGRPESTSEYKGLWSLESWKLGF